MGKIFYIMGKSSSGKDTLYKMLLEKFTDFKTIILYTTRPIREGEEDGVEYHFVNEEETKNLRKAGKIIELREYHTIHGIWSYYTVDDGQVDLTSNNYLVIGTLDSYNKIKKYYGEEYLVPLYIEVEDGERLMRALKREQNQEHPKYSELCRRFLADQEDFLESKIQDAGIHKRFHNIDSKVCFKELEQYIIQQLGQKSR